jgi:hypothetical protein
MRGDFCGMGKCRDFSKHLCEALAVLRGSAFAVPEPSASFMALLGMAGCVLRRRR